MLPFCHAGLAARSNIKRQIQEESYYDEIEVLEVCRHVSTIANTVYHWDIVAPAC